MPGIVYFVPESFSWIWEETGTFPPLSFSMSTWSCNFLLHECRHYISTRQSIGSARGTPKAPKKPSFDLSLIPTQQKQWSHLNTGYSWKYFLSCNGLKVEAYSVEKTAILVIIPSQRWKALRWPSFKITWHLLYTITLSNSCTPNSEYYRNDTENQPKIKYRACTIQDLILKLEKVWL